MIKRRVDSVRRILPNFFFFKVTYREFSKNLLITAIDSENDEMNTVRNQDIGSYGGVPDVARYRYIPTGVNSY